MPTKQKIASVVCLLFGALVWGLIWYPLRLLEKQGIREEVSTFAAYAVALLLGIFFFGRELRQFRKLPAVLAWLGLSAGWANLAYVIAVIHGEVMRVLLLFYLAPLWTVMLARLLLAEKVTATGYVILALSLSGAMVVLWRTGAPPLPVNAAEWLGLSAGFMFALSNVLTRRAAHASTALKSLVAWVGVTSTTMLFLFWKPVPPSAVLQFPQTAWLLLLFLGGVIFLVTVAMQYGLSNIPASQAIVILLFELVVAALSSYFLAGEALSLREWLGGAMIIAASLFSGRIAPKENQESSP